MGRRILTRADTIAAVPPPYYPERETSAASSPMGPGGNGTAPGRPASGTTTKTDSTTADDPFPPSSQEKDSIPMQAIPDMPYVTGADADFNTPRRWVTAVNDGDDERMLLNVGGVRHETHVSTLRAIPNSRLSRLAELHVQSGGGLRSTSLTAIPPSSTPSSTSTGPVSLGVTLGLVPSFVCH